MCQHNTNQQKPFSKPTSSRVTHQAWKNTSLNYVLRLLRINFSQTIFDRRLGCKSTLDSLESWVPLMFMKLKDSSAPGKNLVALFCDRAVLLVVIWFCPFSWQFFSKNTKRGVSFLRRRDSVLSRFKIRHQVSRWMKNKAGRIAEVNGSCHN